MRGHTPRLKIPRVYADNGPAEAGPYVGLRPSLINFDLYNALNGNPVRSVNSAYTAWLTPTAILDARLFKISVQYDF